MSAQVTMIDVLIISASNGKNLKLAQRFAFAAEALGLSIDLLDLTELDLPLFTPRARDSGQPSGLPVLQARLEQGRCWIICAPEYNGSIPPVLTSAFAWLSILGNDFRALFNGRPMAIASHSGSGGYEVLMALRLQLSHLGAQVVGRQIISNSSRVVHDSSIEAILDALRALCPHK
jgi:chromate reductase, NAD(P)H dehydrogenase (quinone)